MAIRSSILAWKIPWTEEPCRVQFMGLQRVSFSCSRALSRTHFLFFVFSWFCCVACEILISRPGIKPRTSAVKAQSPNHWTTKESPGLKVFNPYVSFGSSGLWQSSRLSLLLIILAAEDSFCRMPLVEICLMSFSWFPWSCGETFVFDAPLLFLCWTLPEHVLSQCGAKRSPDDLSSSSRHLTAAGPRC